MVQKYNNRLNIATVQPIFICVIGKLTIEELVHLVEAAELRLSKLLHAFPYSVDGFYALYVGFGEKFVGIADDFFFQRNGEHVAVGQGQLLCDDFLAGKSGSRMAFAHKGMALESESAQKFGSDNAVPDVRFSTGTVNVRGVGFENAYVVEDGGIVDEVLVDFAFESGGYLKRLFGYLTAVNPKCVKKFGVGRVVFQQYVFGCEIVNHVSDVWEKVQGAVEVTPC